LQFFGGSIADAHGRTTEEEIAQRLFCVRRLFPLRLLD
jgi:hypothetical protein